MRTLTWYERQVIAPASTAILLLLTLSQAACSSTESPTRVSEDDDKAVSVSEQPRLKLEERPLLTTQASVRRILTPDRAEVLFFVEAVNKKETEATGRVAEGVSKLEAALGQLPTGAKLATESLTTSEVKSRRRGYNYSSNWRERSLGYRAQVSLSITGLHLKSVEGIVRKGLAAGAQGVEVNVSHSDCSGLLREARTAALQEARMRAERLAKAARATLGTLYRIREQDNSCETQPSQVLSLHLGASERGKTPHTNIHWPSEPLKAFRSRTQVTATIGVVYGLAQKQATPSGETPGEIHLGMKREEEFESTDVTASFTLSLDETSHHPQRALDAVEARVRKLRRSLEQLGVKSEFYQEQELTLGTNFRDVGKGAHEYSRATDYTAVVNWTLETKKVKDVGNWIVKAAEFGALSAGGPRFELSRDPERRTALWVKAIERAMADSDGLAEAGRQVVRSVSQIRTDGLWIVGNDPLQALLAAPKKTQEESDAEARLARLSAFGMIGKSVGGGGRDQRARAVPQLSLHAPKMSESAEIALGVALQPMKEGKAAAP